MGFFEDTPQSMHMEDDLRKPLDLPGKRVMEETGKPSDARDSLEAEVAARMQLATVVEQTTEGIVIAGPDGIISYVNPSVQKNGYWTGVKAIGKHLGSCQDTRHESFSTDMWDSLQKGDTWAGRMTEPLGDGSHRVLDVTALPMSDSEGSVTAYISILRDVTKEVQLQQQLFQSQKMETLGAVAAGIAHDFGNLLTAIIGFTERALNETEAGARARDHMENVRTAGLRARELVQHILTFSRHTTRYKERVDLKDLVGQSLGLLRGSLPRDIDIDFRLDSSPAHVWAESSQLHQVIMNLCVNAVHAMKEGGGRLTIEVGSCSFTSSEETPGHTLLNPGGYVKLSVTDTGVGMTAEVQERVFDPFFTTKEDGEGTGLGLAVVRGIVANHGGAVTVSSEPRRGSTFTVYLPKLAELQPTEVKADGPLPAQRVEEEPPWAVSDT